MVHPADTLGLAAGGVEATGGGGGLRARHILRGLLPFTHGEIQREVGKALQAIDDWSTQLWGDDTPAGGPAEEEGGGGLTEMGEGTRPPQPHPHPQHQPRGNHQHRQHQSAEGREENYDGGEDGALLHDRDNGTEEIAATCAGGETRVEGEGGGDTTEAGQGPEAVVPYQQQHHHHHQQHLPSESSGGAHHEKGGALAVQGNLQATQATQPWTPPPLGPLARLQEPMRRRWEAQRGWAANRRRSKERRRMGFGQRTRRSRSEAQRRRRTRAAGPMELRGDPEHRRRRAHAGLE